MSDDKHNFSLDFYITEFRGMFKKIFVIYGLCVLVMGYIYYQINSRPVLTYYAASESGVLKRVSTFSENQAQRYQQAP